MGVVHKFEELYSTEKTDKKCTAANQWFSMIICATQCWSGPVAVSIWDQDAVSLSVMAHVGKSSLQQLWHSRCVSQNLGMPDALLWEHQKSLHFPRKPMILGPTILKSANVTCATPAPGAGRQLPVVCRKRGMPPCGMLPCGIRRWAENLTTEGYFTGQNPLCWSRGKGVGQRLWKVSRILKD